MKSLVVKLACIALLLGGTLVSTPASSDTGAGSLVVAGATSTPTHWDIPIGVPTIAQICGVTTAEAGDPLPATLTVWVKSSFLGNTQLTANWIGGDCYEFIYTPPSVANGDGIDACETTVVAYVHVGLNANNDICDDGIDNDSHNAACGLRFVDEHGDPIICSVLGVEARPWSLIKELYR
jgi:hypothetical protein